VLYPRTSRLNLLLNLTPSEHRAVLKRAHREWRYASEATGVEVSNAE
jgi:hypothetical protein